jgi:lactose/cellobiose-specific phosphotransferase system IIC component
VLPHLPNSLATLSDAPLIMGIREGFMYMVPLLIVGSIIVAILNIPIPAFQNTMLSVFGDGWKTLPLIIHNAVMQVISLSAVICISFSISSRERLVKSGVIRQVYPVLTAFVSYIAYFKPNEIADAAISAKDAGASSMFSAMLISIISVKLLTFLYAKYDALIPERSYNYKGNSALRGSFHIIPPIFLVVLFFALVNMLIHNTGLSENLSHGFTLAFRDLFLSENVGSVILIAFATNILWFFGIHGGNVFMEALGNAQQSAVAQGLEISQYSKEFFDVFVYFGGAGSTLALCAVLLLFGEKNSDKKLAKGAIFPSLFNINEPLIFGLPIVLNPYYFIPFLLAPLVASTISFIAMETGMVPLPSEDIPWTTPIFVSGYLATGAVSAIILQFVCFLTAFLIYMPFVSMSRVNAEEKYKDDYKDLTKEISYLQSTQLPRMMNRADDVGSVARYIGREIQKEIEAETGDLHMEFQPKSTKEGKVIGAESLIRWTHPVFGFISPPVILGLADEAGLGTALGRWVIRDSLKGMKVWYDQGFTDLRLSINLSPSQLKEDADLGDFIADTLTEFDIPPVLAEFELTENATIEQTEQLLNTLKVIKNNGASVSIDDFGMGHSSLQYLFDFFANVVKLDISLTQGVTEGEDRKTVVRAILDLCKKLGVKVIAEGVETKEQLDIISELGADYFQGWYFSKALPLDKFLEYLAERGTEAEQS